jgi:hypothetical protein
MKNRMTTMEAAAEWARAQSNQTLTEWAAKMNQSNRAKANMSSAAREMMGAAAWEMKTRMSK